MTIDFKLIGNVVVNGIDYKDYRIFAMPIYPKRITMVNQ
jgi:hypothetical protein